MVNLNDRDEIEAGLLAKLLKLLETARREIWRIWREKGQPLLLDAQPALEALRAALEALWTLEYEDIFMAAVADNSDLFGLALDWGLVNERAAQWARRQAGEFASGVVAQRTRAINLAIEGFYRNGWTLQQLSDRLSKQFGEARAQEIAITETTRAASAGESEFVEQLKRYGVEMQAFWVTNEDNIVCPICAPRDGRPQGEAWRDPPPSHPRCRCWIRHEVVLPDDLKIAAVKALPHATFIPPLEVARAARRGLNWRDEFGRGGTAASCAKAQDLSKRRAVNLATVRRMAAYFAAHAADKEAETWGATPPSAGRIAWALWGDDAGREWTQAILKGVGDG